MSTLEDGKIHLHGAKSTHNVMLANDKISNKPLLNSFLADGDAFVKVRCGNYHCMALTGIF